MKYAYACPVCGREYTKQTKPENGKCADCGAFLRLSAREDMVQPEKENKTPVPVKKDTHDEKKKTPAKRISAAVVSRTNGNVQPNSNLPQTTPRHYGVRKKKTETPDISTTKRNSVSSAPIQTTVVSGMTTGGLPNRHAESEGYLEGTVVSATSNSDYKRYGWEKLMDKYRYGQRVSDVRNTIRLRCVDSNGNAADRNVVIHGDIEGGVGIINTGMSLRAYGKWNDKHEFIAKRILCSDSFEVSVRTELKDVWYLVLPFLIGFIIFLFIAGMGNMGSASDSTSGGIGIIIPFLLAFAGCNMIFGKRSRRPFFYRMRTYFVISLIVEIIYLMIKVSS